MPSNSICKLCENANDIEATTTIDKILFFILYKYFYFE